MSLPVWLIHLEDGYHVIRIRSSEDPMRVAMGAVIMSVAIAFSRMSILLDGNEVWRGRILQFWFKAEFDYLNHKFCMKTPFSGGTILTMDGLEVKKAERFQVLEETVLSESTETVDVESVPLDNTYGSSLHIYEDKFSKTIKTEATVETSESIGVKQSK